MKNIASLRLQESILYIPWARVKSLSFQNSIVKKYIVFYTDHSGTVTTERLYCTQSEFDQLIQQWSKSLDGINESCQS